MKTLSALLLTACIATAAEFVTMPPPLTNGPAFNGVPLLARHTFVQQKYGQSLRWVTKLSGADAAMADAQAMTTVNVLGQQMEVKFFFFRVATNDLRLHRILVLVRDIGPVVVQLETKYGAATVDSHYLEWKLTEQEFKISLFHDTTGNAPLCYLTQWGQREVERRQKKAASPDL